MTIPGGMVYVGFELAVPGRYGNDNCLINPRLAVAKSVGPNETLGLHYWPDYASISPAGRRAYLNWLAAGRRDPTADIGLVFLFFYGLERRLFLERALAEAPALVKLPRFRGRFADRDQLFSTMALASYSMGER